MGTLDAIRTKRSVRLISVRLPHGIWKSVCAWHILVCMISFRSCLAFLLKNREPLRDQDASRWMMY